jgi:hypothetical protein
MPGSGRTCTALVLGALEAAAKSAATGRAISPPLAAPTCLQAVTVTVALPIGWSTGAVGALLVVVEGGAGAIDRAAARRAICGRVVDGYRLSDSGCYTATCEQSIGEHRLKQGQRGDDGS